MDPIEPAGLATPPALAARLARLDPDQLAAATAEPGPILCVAAAGSGKTTTLVARVCWLLATGRGAPGAVTAIAFNRRAAEELTARLATALAELGAAAGSVRVRTFHALGGEVLRGAGRRVEPLVDRAALLRRLWPAAGPAGWRRLDDAFSRLKLDRLAVAEDLAGSEPGSLGEAFVSYEAALAAGGGLDFDDLVARALRLLETDAQQLARWRSRCVDLLVDEAQDLDRAQLRLVLLLAGPANRVFLVGDDDQSIYGWRLADVRRVLTLAAALPSLRRIDLSTNYRCPAPVVERAVRLVSVNRERFVKTVRPRTPAPGRLVLAPDGSDDDVRAARVLHGWPDDDGTRAILARTNRELLPAAVAALEAGVPFRAGRLALLVDDPRLDALLARVEADRSGLPLPVRLERLRAAVATAEAFDGVHAVAGGPAVGVAPAGLGEADDAEPRLPGPTDGVEPDLALAELARALLAWAVPFRTLDELRAALAGARTRLATLRTDDARLTLATAHATKGLEFDHVAVLGLDAGRFPSARTLAESADPRRALEEERRLAYVAWTRARRSLTLVYDPAAPSPFLREAFSDEELGRHGDGEGRPA